MNKQFKCERCGVNYRVRKTNFYKNAKSKSGYAYHCKKCNEEMKRNCLAKKSPEEMEKIKLRSDIAKKIAMAEGRYKPSIKYQISYKNSREQRNKTRNLANLKRRNAERLVSYEKKLYWAEKREIILLDIKQEEY